MSYSLPLEHKLNFDNIHDMITIDMKPVTTCNLMRDSMHITGYMEYAGTYLTVDLGEESFTGIIPVDITLPYFGGAPDVRLEISAFDYDVVTKQSLTLRMDVDLTGYDHDSSVLDAYVSSIDDVVEEEEAYFEEESIPYSPLVPVTADMVREGDTLSLKEVEEPVISPVIEEEPVREIEVEVENKHEFENDHVQEDDTTYVVPEQPEFFETPVVTQDSFYNRLFVNEEPLVLEREEEVVYEEEEVIEHAVLEQPATCTNESVARQFADGQTRVKMVYVRSESELLGEVLERNSARVEDVWNLSKLDDVVRAGDCVMIRYDKSE